jgi:hypothetical protein
LGGDFARIRRAVFGTLDWPLAAAARAGGGPPAQKKTRRGFYERIFSLRVTLWYLIFQRLNDDRTLSAVMKDVRSGGTDRLGPRGRKRSRRACSTNTSAYNQARQRLPLALLQAALTHLADALCQLAGGQAKGQAAPPPQERVRQLVDGSTVAMLLTPDLAREFSVGENQRGDSGWCLMRIVVGFCAKTGAVFSACCGAQQCSEQAMTWSLMEHTAAFTVWIGDANFGVWSIAAQAARFYQDVLVRLSPSRARRLCAGQPLVSGQERWITWEPTRDDKAPPGTERKAVSGRLIYVRVQRELRWIDLWLFTTLPAADYPVELLVRWYGQRWQAELNFRYVKTQLKMDVLHVGTAAMARKEFYAGLLAYSLVRAVMWHAGERLEHKQAVISFSEARRIVIARLMDWGRARCTGCYTPATWLQALRDEVALHTLPRRRKRRPNEPRRVRHRRHKFPPLRGSRAATRTQDATTKSL